MQKEVVIKLEGNSYTYIFIDSYSAPILDA